MNFLFSFLLTLNTTFLLVIIFLIQKGWGLSHFLDKYHYINLIPDSISYLVYFLIPMVGTYLSLLISKFLGKDEFRERDIISIESANDSFLPSYLGYFFIALGINDIEVMIYVFMILSIFIFFSRQLYFNPLFILMGFSFYKLTTKNGVVLILLSKEHYKIPADIKISEARRINNYTFILWRAT